MLVTGLVILIWPAAGASILDTEFTADELSLGAIVLVSVVNPVFEEVFVVGYVLAALRGRIGATNAANVSVAIRTLYHLYQGPVAAVSIVPFGVVFAYWYVRTGRLWPLIIAHALMDFLPLLSQSDRL